MSRAKSALEAAKPAAPTRSSVVASKPRAGWTRLAREPSPAAHVPQGQRPLPDVSATPPGCLRHPSAGTFPGHHGPVRRRRDV